MPQKQVLQLYRHSNKQSIHIRLPLIKLVFDAEKSDKIVIDFYNTLDLYNTINIGHNTRQQ